MARDKVNEIDTPGITRNYARATGRIIMKEITLYRILNNLLLKGNCIEISRLAGILAARKTFQLIPTAFPGNEFETNVLVSPLRDVTGLEIIAEVHSPGSRPEMEALTAVTVASLAVIDLCRDFDDTLRIPRIALAEDIPNDI